MTTADEAIDLPESCIIETTADKWETAWGEYVEALDAAAADWRCPFSLALSARRVREAAARLRLLAPDFCDRVGIS